MRLFCSELPLIWIALSPFRVAAPQVFADLAGVFAQLTGLQPDQPGLQPDVSGVQPHVTGVQPDVSGVQPHQPQLQPDVSGARPCPCRAALALLLGHADTVPVSASWRQRPRATRRSRCRLDDTASASEQLQAAC